MFRSLLSHKYVREFLVQDVLYLQRLKNVFIGRQLVLVQEETFVVFYSVMPRETVRIPWNDVEILKKFSSRSKHVLHNRK